MHTSTDQTTDQNPGQNPGHDPVQQLIDAFIADADRFTDVVWAGGDWSSASPCEGWTAADVLDHVIDTQRSFLALRGAELGPARSAVSADRWAAHRAGVETALATPGFAASSYDGVFGRTTVADTMFRFYGFDLLIHRWDLARALGHDEGLQAWSAAEMDRIEPALDGFGEHLYDEGVCRPALEVAPDASRQVRLLARLGRRA